MDDEQFKVVFLPCHCADSTHHIIMERFEYDVINGVPEYEYCFKVIMSPYQGFFGRLKLAIKYVLGVAGNRSSYYHEVILTEEQFRNLSSSFVDTPNEKEGQRE